MRVVKKGIMNGKQRIMIQFSENFKKYLFLPLEHSEEILNLLKKAKNVDEVNSILTSYNLPTIETKELYAISLESHIHKLLSRKPAELDYNELYQELFLKGLELLSNPKVQTLNETEKWKYIKTALQNRIKDLLYSQPKEVPLSEVVEPESQLSFMDSIMSPESNVNKSPLPIVKFPNPETYTISKELLEIIKNWAETQDESIKLFFEEYFNPSQETISYIEERVKNNKTWKGLSFNPVIVAEALSETGKWKYKDPRDKWIKIKKKMIRDLGLTL